MERYRYGFNGKEKDKDLGEGMQDYGFRIYDNRIGKFLSVDPLAPDYPWYSPYHFAGNSPIAFIDLDGAEPKAAYSDWMPNTKKAGEKHFYGTPKGYDEELISNWNLRMVVDSDKKIFWVVSMNAPGGVQFGEFNWKWFDSKSNKWLPFQPAGYECAVEIARSMKGADKFLSIVFGAGLAAPILALGAAEIGIAYGVSVTSQSFVRFALKKTVDASIDLFGQLATNKWDLSKVDWFDVASNYLPIPKKWGGLIDAAIKNIVGATVNWTKEKGWETVGGGGISNVNAAVEAGIGTIVDGLFSKFNGFIGNQLKKSGFGKDVIEKRTAEILETQRAAVTEILKNAIIERAKPEKED